MEVIATKPGYHGKLRAAGDTFEVPDGSEATWFGPSPRELERQRRAAEEAAAAEVAATAEPAADASTAAAPAPTTTRRKAKAEPAADAPADPAA